MKIIITDIEDFAPQVEGEYRLLKPDDEIIQCIGCFGCWLKTPGKCVMNDGYQMLGAAWGRCEEAILVCRCVYGSPSPFVKNVLDRSIGYVHPDFVMRGGEMHHRRRYDNVIKFSAYFYGDLTNLEKQSAMRWFNAYVDNFDGEIGEVKFFDTKEETEGMKL